MADVLIIYAPADHHFALQVATEARARGASVALDQFIISGSGDGVTAMTELIQAAAVIVILSKLSQRATWLDEDLAKALARKRNIIPVLIDDEATQNWVWPLIATSWRADPVLDILPSAIAARAYSTVSFYKVPQDKKSRRSAAENILANYGLSWLGRLLSLAWAKITIAIMAFGVFALLGKYIFIPASGIGLLAFWTFLGLICAVVGGILAARKKRDHSWWAAWCFVFPPLLLVLLILPIKRANSHYRSLSSVDPAAKAAGARNR